MKRSDVKALYFITRLKNLVSICKKGILCYNKAKKMNPESVADPLIQELREGVIVPGIHKKLHEYTNLYFNPRNPMMFKRKSLHEDLCIICVSQKILDEKVYLVLRRKTK